MTTPAPRRSKSSARAGNSLIMALVFASILVVFSLSLFDFTGFNQSISKRRVNSQDALRVAEAGVEKAVWCMNNPANTTDCSNNPNYSENDVPLGNGTFSVSVIISGNTGTIDSTGVVRGLTGTSTRHVQVKADTTNTDVAFHYGVQVGDGGLEMSNNSNVVGNVYSNGSITGASGTKITGDAIVASTVAENAQASSTPCTEDEVFGQTNPKIDVAQSFVSPVSQRLVKVSIYLKKVGDPGNRTLRLVADASGSPGQTSLANATVSSTLVTASYGWIDVVFPSPPTLAQNATYWIVFDANQNSAKYWVWCKDGNGGYPNGAGKYSEDWDKKPWQSISGDMSFRTFFGSSLNSLTSMIVTGTARANVITASSICGDAYYQTIDSSSLTFLNNPSSPTCASPLTPGTSFSGSPDPVPSNLPISQANIDQWKADAQSGGQVSGDFIVTSNVSLGPKEISEDLVMATNNTTLTLTGTVYVRGNIAISNGAAIRCTSAYQSRSCLIVADGWIHLDNNGTFSGSGQPGSYLMLLSTLACSGVPGTGCGHHDGAVDAHNNVTGVIFYASQGMIHLHNGVGLTEVTAYKLQLDNTATVTYENGLADTTFSSGPGGSWVYRRGTYQVDPQPPAPADTSAPFVTFTSPINFSVVSGTISVSAAASDNVGVVGVQFKLDGANLGLEDITSPYSISWNTRTASDCAHTLTAVAKDAAGNTATSSEVAITVANSGVLCE